MVSEWEWWGHFQSGTQRTSHVQIAFTPWLVGQDSREPKEGVACSPKIVGRGQSLLPTIATRIGLWGDMVWARKNPDELTSQSNVTINLEHMDEFFLYGGA